MANYKIKKSDILIATLLISGILIVINIFAGEFFLRFDITENKDYSVSKVSKEAVKKLDDIVVVKAYFSKTIPAEYITLEQEVADILDEYKNYSDGKFKVEFIDPTEDEDTETELMMIGIPALQFNILEKDSYKVVKGYAGIAITFGGKTEVIPVVESTKNLEYKITTAIKKASSSGDMASIGLVSSNGAYGYDSGIMSAYESLGELYDVRAVDLNSSIPEEIKTLVIPGLREELEESHLKKIDAFVAKGGYLLVLADGVMVGEGLQAIPNVVGLEKLIEHYGIKINNDLVLDSRNAIGSFTSGFISFSVNYPFWPKVLKDGFNKENIAVSDLESVVFPWVSSLDIAGDKEAEGIIFQNLISSTENSWLMQGNFDLNPNQEFATENIKIYNLAIMTSGKFNPFYEENKSDIAKEGKIIVVGDSDFILDNFLSSSPENLVLFQNLVDILSLDDDLIKIRSKGISSRPLKELSDSVKSIIKNFNVFGLAIIVIIFGAVRYSIRRRGRN